MKKKRKRMRCLPEPLIEEADRGRDDLLELLRRLVALPDLKKRP